MTPTANKDKVQRQTPIVCSVCKKDATINLRVSLNPDGTSDLSGIDMDDKQCSEVCRSTARPWEKIRRDCPVCGKSYLAKVHKDDHSKGWRSTRVWTCSSKCSKANSRYVDEVRECLNCNEPFQTLVDKDDPSLIRADKNAYFCSQACNLSHSDSKMESKECETCGVAFQIMVHSDGTPLADEPRRFCSRACSSRSFTYVDEDRQCEQCGDSFQTKIHPLTGEVRKSFPTRFCSPECNMNHNQPAWKISRKLQGEYEADPKLCACGAAIAYRDRHRSYCSDLCLKEFGKVRRPDPAKWVTFKCELCGKEKTVRKRYGVQKYCSINCSSKSENAQSLRSFVYNDRGERVGLDSTWESFFWGIAKRKKLRIDRVHRQSCAVDLTTENGNPGNYAPDFKVTTKDRDVIWVEVKGILSDRAMSRAKVWREATGSHYALLDDKRLGAIEGMYPSEMENYLMECTKSDPGGSPDPTLWDEEDVDEIIVDMYLAGTFSQAEIGRSVGKHQSWVAKRIPKLLLMAEDARRPQ